MADAALLAVLACFGLIAPIHETTANASQVLCVALHLFGLSVAIDRPRRGGLLVGLAIAASLLTYGIPLAVVMLLATLLLLWLVVPFRLVAGWILLTMLPVAVLGSIVWPALLAYFSHSDAVVQALPLMEGPCCAASRPAPRPRSPCCALARWKSTATRAPSPWRASRRS